MIKFKCQCCGLEKDFKDAEEAYHAGWDIPPYFTQATTCDLCPASGLVLGVSHNKAHAHWVKFGRPKTFSFSTCGLDPDWIKGENN